MPHTDLRRPVIFGHEPEQVASSECASMRSVLDTIRTVAPTRATVLLTGETGVGKSLIARLIHHWSKRRDKRFVAVHCGAIPDTLVESELFGHEKGSFTGAHRRQSGQFELADGGTLFLDEVGTITLSAQVKLLDVLQGRSFHRVGGEEEIEVDVRVVSASNGDLELMQKEGRFRTDLFYRLNVFPVKVPPLRERKEDLPKLMEQLVDRLNDLYAKGIEGLDPTVERAFLSYAWPGNIRELENVLERAYILESAKRISPRNIPAAILDSAEPHVFVPVGSKRTLAAVRADAVATAERRYLEEILATHQGRVDASARAAGVTTRQLRKLLAKHEIRKADFKPAASAPESRATAVGETARPRVEQAVRPAQVPNCSE